MSESLWVTVIQWTVWGVVMALVLGGLARSRYRKQPDSEASKLVHPRSILIVGLIGFAFFAGLAIISNVFSNETTTVITTSVFIGFALLNLLLVAEYSFSRHWFSDDGLEYGSLLGRRGRLDWSEVASVRYAPVMKWFRLETGAGKVARISAMLVGLPDFARTLLARVDPSAIEPEARAVVRATAAGELPEIWM